MRISETAAVPRSTTITEIPPNPAKGLPHISFGDAAWFESIQFPAQGGVLAPYTTDEVPAGVDVKCANVIIAHRTYDLIKSLVSAECLELLAGFTNLVGYCIRHWVPRCNLVVQVIEPSGGEGHRLQVRRGHRPPRKD
jgi:hypothetical protein